MSRLLAYARNTWRALTSMGTALVLLFLLALGAMPGALLPQRSLNAGKVDDYLAAHPKIGPLLDKLQAFNVFGSFWFTAIYTLLFVSLLGCLTPRMIEHARNMRATPVPAPRNLTRLPKHAVATIAGEPDELADTFTERLRGWRTSRPPRRHHRDLRRERLSARIRQPGLPFLAAGSAGRGGRRQAVRLRGQRRRDRRRRTRVLLGITRRVRLVPGRQHRRRHVAASDLPARQRLQGEVPAVGAGDVVRRRHRLPVRPRPRPAAAGGPTGWRSTTRCGSAAIGCTCRATATRRRSPSSSPTGRSAPRPCSGGPTTRRRCCPPGVARIDPPAGTYPDAAERRKHQIAITGSARTDRATRRHPAVVELPRADRARGRGRHLHR